jgi:hypothetical protein
MSEFRKALDSNMYFVTLTVCRWSLKILTRETRARAEAAVLFFLFFVSYNLYGQNQNSIWIFGDSAGIDFTNLNNPIPIASSMVGRGSCVSIADTSSNLLFYSNTRGGAGNTGIIWDQTNQVLQNGDSIVGQAWFNEMVIVPMPDSINKYYLFSIGITTSSAQGLFYSIIDMSLNGGLGAVTQKNIQLLNFRMADCIGAIKHGNGRDWWLIAKPSIPSVQYNRFYIYLITPWGISTPSILDLGNARDTDFQKFYFNSDGKRLMLINIGGFMAEYDFDRCTGIISSPNLIFTQQTSNLTRLFWEGAYSSNDSLFYISSKWLSMPNDTSRLLQYNLTAPNIPLSCDTLFEIEYPVQIEAVRLGPDKKIYVANFYDCQCTSNSYPYPDSVRNVYNEHLGVVNYPDIDGMTCNYQPFSFYLGGKRAYSGLPNNPNYSLGPAIGSGCDTIFTTTATLQNNNTEIMLVLTLQEALSILMQST